MANLAWFHLELSTLTLVVVTAAALQAVILAFFEYQLGHKRLAQFMSRLPALEIIERWLFRLILLGFVLLSLLMVESMVVFQHILVPPLLSKTLCSIFVWAVFALLLIGRYLGGWRGRTAIRWTLFGFTLIVLIYLGSDYLLN